MSMSEERFRRAFVLLLVVAISAAFVAMIRTFLLTILMAAIFAGVARPLFVQVERAFRGRSVSCGLSTRALSSGGWHFLLGPSGEGGS